MVITEIGGTIGDIESQPFLEAIRQISREARAGATCLFLHVTLVPYLKSSGEHKIQAHPAFGARAAGSGHHARHHRRALRRAARGGPAAEDRPLLQRRAGLRHRKPHPAGPLRGAAHAARGGARRHCLPQARARGARGRPRRMDRHVRADRARDRAGARSRSSANTSSCTTPTFRSPRRCATAGMSDGAQRRTSAGSTPRRSPTANVAERLAGCGRDHRARAASAAAASRG